MNKETILYQNNWCKIVSKETFYIIKSKSGKYNDRYFFTLDEAKKSVGLVVI